MHFLQICCRNTSHTMRTNVPTQYGKNHKNNLNKLFKLLNGSQKLLINLYQLFIVYISFRITEHFNPIIAFFFGKMYRYRSFLSYILWDISVLLRFILTAFIDIFILVNPVQLYDIFEWYFYKNLFYRTLYCMNIFMCM